MTNDEMFLQPAPRSFRASPFGFISSFVLRHSDFIKSFPARELLHLLFQGAIAARTQNPRRLACRRARKLSSPGHRYLLHRPIEPCLRATFAERVRRLPRDRAAGHPTASAEPAPRRSDNCDRQKLRVRFLIHSLHQRKRARSSLARRESALDRQPQSRAPLPRPDQDRAPPYYIEPHAVLHDLAEHRRPRQLLEKRQVDTSPRQKLYRMRPAILSGRSFRDRKGSDVPRPQHRDCEQPRLIRAWCWRRRRETRTQCLPK